MKKLVLSRTPLRISFIGGGSDLERFWRYEKGTVISAAINLSIDVLLRQSCRADYSIISNRVEEVSNFSQINHRMIRESFASFNIDSGLDCAILSDVNSLGSGLGSSSSLIVGLINAISVMNEINLAPSQLTVLASDVEINRCDRTIGFQDHAAAAYGGFAKYHFNTDGSIERQDLDLDGNKLKILLDHLLLLDTGIARSSSRVLNSQINKDKSGSFFYRSVKQLLDLIDDFEKALKHGNIGDLAKILDISWRIKEEMGAGNDIINKAYETAKRNGALGGKLLGAGGGGHMLLVVKPHNRLKILEELQGFKEISFDFALSGSRIIYSS